MKDRDKLEENVLVLKEAEGWDKGWEVPLPCDRDHTRLSTSTQGFVLTPFLVGCPVAFPRPRGRREVHKGQETEETHQMQEAQKGTGFTRSFS